MIGRRKKRKGKDFIFPPKDGKINEEGKRLVNLGEKNGSF